jgi:hypothetical protein
MTVLRLPPPGAPREELCDWLELCAFFSEYGLARLDELSGGMKTMEAEPPDGIGDRDIDDDGMRSEIEAEIDARRSALNGAYPFQLTDDAEELRLIVDRDRPEAAFYLLCLIAAHTARSSILARPPENEIERRMRRRAFQIMGTLSLAGCFNGTAVSVGWPRESKETILDVLRRAESWGIGLAPRDIPGKHSSPMDKDGGVDVIAWRPEITPPPAVIAFGQLASGHNWRDKPLKADLNAFLNSFFEDHGTENHVCATIVPHIISDQLVLQSESQRHGFIAHRMNAPRHALAAFAANQAGLSMDEADKVSQIGDWLRDYRTQALSA